MTRAENVGIPSAGATKADRFTEADLERFTRLMTTMRAGGVHAVRAWMEATEAELGGRLVLQAPTRSNGKGHLPEAAYQSQFWGSLLSGDAPQ